MLISLFLLSLLSLGSVGRLLPSVELLGLFLIPFVHARVHDGVLLHQVRPGVVACVTTMITGEPEVPKGRLLDLLPALVGPLVGWAIYLWKIPIP